MKIRKTFGFLAGRAYGSPRLLDYVPGALMFQTPEHYHAWDEADAARRIQTVLNSLEGGTDADAS